jgi:hypothetical protein
VFVCVCAQGKFKQACFSPVELLVLFNNQSTANNRVFHYMDYPVIESVTPEFGDALSSTWITLSGVNLFPSETGQLYATPTCIIGGFRSEESYYNESNNVVICKTPVRVEYGGSTESALQKVTYSINGQSATTGDRVFYGYRDELYIRGQGYWFYFWGLFYFCMAVWVLAWTRHILVTCCRVQIEEDAEPPQFGPSVLITKLEETLKARRIENIQKGVDEDGAPMTLEMVEKYVNMEEDMSERGRKKYKKELLMVRVLCKYVCMYVCMYVRM